MALEEDFNETMLGVLRDLPMQDIYQVWYMSSSRQQLHPV